MGASPMHLRHEPPAHGRGARATFRRTAFHRGVSMNSRRLLLAGAAALGLCVGQLFAQQQPAAPASQPTATEGRPPTPLLDPELKSWQEDWMKTHDQRIAWWK